MIFAWTPLLSFINSHFVGFFLYLLGYQFTFRMKIFHLIWKAAYWEIIKKDNELEIVKRWTRKAMSNMLAESANMSLIGWKKGNNNVHNGKMQMVNVAVTGYVATGDLCVCGGGGGGLKTQADNSRTPSR